MPGHLAGHPFFQEARNTISRFGRWCGSHISDWTAQAREELEADLRRTKPWNTSIVTSFCPCVTCGKTWHRLHYKSDMSGYEIINVPCAAYCYTFVYCTPLAHGLLVCIPFAWQTYRIRKLGDLGGTCIADVFKTWFCTCCSLIQNEKESKLLLEGRTTGFWGGDGTGAERVVVQQPSGGLGEDMVMPAAIGVGENGLSPVDERAEVELAGEPVFGIEEQKDVVLVVEPHPHTDGAADRNSFLVTDVPPQASDSNTIVDATERKIVIEESTSDHAVVESLATL